MQYPLDDKGNLKNLADWDTPCLYWFAEQEAISVTSEHLDVIQFFRDFYVQYSLTPSMRVLLKFLRTRWSTEKVSSTYLQQLFPKSVMLQASRLAGLPKPTRCL